MCSGVKPDLDVTSAEEKVGKVEKMFSVVLEFPIAYTYGHFFLKKQIHVSFCNSMHMISILHSYHVTPTWIVVVLQ